MASIGELCRAVERECGCCAELAVIIRGQLVWRLDCWERLIALLLVRVLSNAGSFTFLQSRLFFLRHTVPSDDVAHQVFRKLSVFSSIRTSQGYA
ncbi:MAG: hypothetical protein ABI988_15725 [Nitrospirota bacterium]